VTAAGEKMSKSLGNGALVSEVTRSYPPRAVRFYLLTPHYRSAIEFSDESLAEATAALARIDGFVERARELAPDAGVGALPAEFVDAMNDDLATPAAVAVLYADVREGNTAIESGDAEAVGRPLGRVRAMLGALGLDLDDPAWQRSSAEEDYRPVVDGLVAALLGQRGEARQRKDYAAADAIRHSLNDLGITIEDTPRGARWSLTRQGS
jgi:cysteinyl-tRNA synthetase